MRQRIVCTNQEPILADHDKAHIVEVRVEGSPRLFPLAEVLASMKFGAKFYTRDEKTRKEADVEPYNCSRCQKTYIRSTADATEDNNLDSLGSCNMPQ